MMASKPRNLVDRANAAAGHVGKWDKSGTFTAIAQVLLLAMFWFFDELFIKTNFKCPCVENEICGRSFIYSFLFIVLSTLLAAVLGTAALLGVTRRFAKQKKNVKQTNGQEEVGDQGESSSGTQAVPTTSRQRGLPMQNLGQRVVIDQGESSSGTQEGKKTDKVTDRQDRQGKNTSKEKACITVACRRRTIIVGCSQFLLVAFAWLAVLCIDGDYVACAATCHPYGNASCTDVRAKPENELPFSSEFNKIKRSVSQPIGIGFALFVAFAILLSLVIHCKTQCKDVKKCYAFEEQVDDTDAKVAEAKELLKIAVPEAYIVKNL